MEKTEPAKPKQATLIEPWDGVCGLDTRGLLWTHSFYSKELPEHSFSERLQFVSTRFAFAGFTSRGSTAIVELGRNAERTDANGHTWRTHALDGVWLPVDGPNGQIRHTADPVAYVIVSVTCRRCGERSDVKLKKKLFEVLGLGRGETECPRCAEYSRLIMDMPQDKETD